MTVEQTGPDERQTRLDWMLEEFRAAQQRRQVKQGIERRNRELAEGNTAAGKEPAPELVR